jgi:hypothetical protein
MFARRKDRRRKPAAPLSLTQLEPRDVPALWSLQLLSPSAGDPGDTAATHSGGLTLSTTTIEARTPSTRSCPR